MKKLKLIICFAVSAITISACSTQAKVDATTVIASSVESTAAESTTVVSSEAESTTEVTTEPETTTAAPTETESTTEVTTEAESTTETSTVAESTTAPEKLSTDFFDNVYAPYANRKKPFIFEGVKTFSESCGYKTEITNPSDEDTGEIKIFDDNGDYVYFSFSPINGIETIMTVSFYQASSNSEVSLSNYSSDGSSEYDEFSAHIIGESKTKVKSVDQQRKFLFK